jgi:hypothetical protein
MDRHLRNPASAMSKTLDLLGSPRWFNAGGMRAFALRQRMHQLGIRREHVMQRPCIAIVNAV